jgi:hypothetical protein
MRARIPFKAFNVNEWIKELKQFATMYNNVQTVHALIPSTPIMVHWCNLSCHSNPKIPTLQVILATFVVVHFLAPLPFFVHVHVVVE